MGFVAAPAQRAANHETQRNSDAACGFLRKAIDSSGQPEKINIDGSEAGGKPAADLLVEKSSKEADTKQTGSSACIHRGCAGGQK